MRLRLIHPTFSGLSGLGVIMDTIKSIGLVGGGQMGEALVRGVIESGLVQAENIMVAE
ncbi:MAG: NAD(P)-binding domain-containing protein, partial [Thermodesulfobacteriota bacterium]|nr:NAD(P)-binding domain-containing protein [Thermodesulfobacteriota bacterium]